MKKINKKGKIKMNYIYCFTNKINGKKYIGSTTISLENRYK